MPSESERLTMTGAVEFILDTILPSALWSTPMLHRSQDRYQASVCNYTYAGKEDPV
jgi:hypothetical protein